MLHPRSTRTQSFKTLTFSALAIAFVAACDPDDVTPPIDAGSDAAEPEPDAEVDAAEPEPEPDAGCEADEDAGGSGCCGEEQVLDDIFDPVVLPAGTCWRVNELLSATRVELTVERGVRIAFAPSAGLEAHSGSITMNGTAEEPIVLTSIEPGGEWRGMHFSESTPSVPGTYVIEHVVFERGGESVGNGGLDGMGQHRASLLLTGASDVTLDSVTFRGSPSYGLLVRDPQVVLSARATRFVQNHIAVLLPLYRLDALDSATKLEDNDDQRIHVGRPFDHGLLGGERNVVVAPIAPYYVTSAEYMDATLTLQPGTRLEFARHAGLQFRDNGSLVAEGTAEKPIELVGATDERAFWRGMYFTDSSVSVSLEHVTFANAGSLDWTGHDESLGGLFMTGTLDITIANSTFRSHAGSAFSPVKSAKSLNWSIATTEFRDNERPALLATAQVAAFGDGITFADNDVDALVVGRTDDVRPSALEEATDWAALSLRFDDDLIVRAPLTIAPGAVLRFGEDLGLTVDEGGELDVGGMDAQTILTNNGEGEPAWRGVAIKGGTGHSLEWTLIERGGSSADTSDAAANLHIFSGASVYLNRIDLVDSEGHGLSVHTDSTLDPCTGLIYEGNAGEDFHSYGEGSAPVCP